MYCNVMYVQIVGTTIEFGRSRLMRQPVPNNPPHLAECIPLTNAGGEGMETTLDTKGI